MTLKDKFISKKLDFSHLEVIGYLAYMHVFDDKKTKLDSKVEKCIFIGYSLKQMGYICFNPSIWKL
jgi:hypothetical protein